MGSDSIFYYGKAEAGSTKFATATFVYAIESLKEMIQMLHFYTRSVVGYGKVVEMTPIFFQFRAVDVEVGGTVGIGNSIVDEVAENAVDEARVAQYLYMLRYMKHGGDTFVVQI